MWRFLLPLGGFAILVLFFFVGLHREPSAIPSPLIGKSAPAFSLASVNDPQRLVSTADLRGRMYLLNVWGTWCVGCREEHATLLTVAQSQAVPIIGLNWKDDRELAMRWLKDLGDPYLACAFDPEGRTAIDWGVYGAPESFLVSADGRIVLKHIGPLTLEIWNEKFLPLIRDPKRGES